MMLSSTLARSVASSASAAARRTLSTPAAGYVASSDSLPSYILEAPVPQVSTLSNGVTVASLYSAPGGNDYVTVRVSGIGSRYDKVGGESALLASSLGGEAGREHLSFSSLKSVAGGLAVPSNLDELKSSQIAKVSSLSYDSQMLDQVHGTAFQSSPSGDSLGNALEGTADSIASLTAADVSSVASLVQGGNVCVVGTGSGEHGKLVEQVEKALGGLSGGGKEVGAVKDKPLFIGSDVRIRYDSHKTATIALAFEGASWTSPHSLPLALMTTLLGSYSSSSGLGKNVSAALCQEVADHQLASSISSFNLSYSDTGLFGFVATAPDNKLDDLMWYVMPNMVRLAHGFSDEELARAKATLKAQLLSSMDGDIALGQEVARQMQTIGRVMPLAELVKRVDDLTMGDVKAAASDVINDQDHALAAIGGIHELPDYNWIRRHSYMLRY